MPAANAASTSLRDVLTNAILSERIPYTAEQVDELLAQVLTEFAQRDRNALGKEAADALADAIATIRMIFDPELKRVATLTAERDEADRRAGAAERERASDRDDVVRLARVRDRMKEQWGVHRNVSFDVVWDEALALKAAAQRRLGLPMDQEPKYTVDGWNIINRASGKLCR